LNLAVGVIEARTLCPAVQVPTLVLHRREDPFVSVENSRYLAGALPDATYTELNGVDHPPWVGDTAPVFTLIEEFLAREHPPIAQSRQVLSTIVRVDPAVPPGQLHLVQRHQGRASGTPQGIGYFFDSPTRALTFAFELLHEHPSNRAALHYGQVSLTATGLTGPAVDATDRILHHCQDGQILITRTIRDLTVGTATATDPIRIDDQTWELFNAQPPG